jgi:hypothetical protein
MSAAGARFAAETFSGDRYDGAALSACATWCGTWQRNRVHRLLDGSRTFGSRQLSPEWTAMKANTAVDTAGCALWLNASTW